MTIDDEVLKRLKKIATPTLANALDDIGLMELCTTLLLQVLV